MTEPHYSQFRPPPREERQTFIDCPDNRFEFQSTLPRGERQKYVLTFLIIRAISIHAPTRGATRLAGFVLLAWWNFNPRSHAGSDCRRDLRHNGVVPFQSTLPRGERRVYTVHDISTAYISIHAPTRGATNYKDNQYNQQEISIHAPTRGATCIRAL